MADNPQSTRGPAEDENNERVAEGLGGVTGATAGAGLGFLLGPVGAVVGGLAGAVGGWWAGKGVSDAAGDFDDETDEHYRRLHEEQETDRPFDDVKHYYRFGALARRNPDYEGRRFEDVEPELRRGWRDDSHHGWEDVRHFVHRGYEGRPENRG